MSTYVLMRILESAPQRYDLGIRLLTLGRVASAYERLVGYIEQGQLILDLGCGTGALALRAARRGANVKAIDVNAQMLEIAERRAREAGLADTIRFQEMGVAELDREEAESYDAVTGGLCFSELTDDELSFALGQVTRVLKPGGVLLVADETRPPNLALRVIQRLIRAPLVALAYVVTQQTTHPIANLPTRLTDAGLTIESTRYSTLGSLIEIVARKPAGVSP